MRFRFAGGLEVPTWVLHAIPPLSELSSVRLKLLARDVLKQLLGGGLDMDRARRFTTPKGAAPDAVRTETCVSGVRYFVTTAVKYGADEAVIQTEMEQLGLPRENVAAILRPYRDSRESLRAKFAADTVAVAPTRPAGCAVDGAGVRLRLSAPDLDIGMSVDKMEVLMYEMEQVRGLMAAAESEG